MLDGGLWTVYRQFGPCSGLSGAVDIEDQAILGNREDLKLLVEGESAVTHSLYVLHAPAVKGDPRGSSQFTQPGVQLLHHPARLPASCRGTHIGGLVLPSLTPSQGCGGSGAENRRGPSGA